jgi:hypothetical protein
MTKIPTGINDQEKDKEDTSEDMDEWESQTVSCLRKDYQLSRTYQDLVRTITQNAGENPIVPVIGEDQPTDHGPEKFDPGGPTIVPEIRENFESPMTQIPTEQEKDKEDTSEDTDEWESQTISCFRIDYQMSCMYQDLVRTVRMQGRIPLFLQ